MKGVGRDRKRLEMAIRGEQVAFSAAVVLASIVSITEACSAFSPDTPGLAGASVDDAFVDAMALRGITAGKGKLWRVIDRIHLIHLVDCDLAATTGDPYQDKTPILLDLRQFRPARLFDA